MTWHLAPRELSAGDWTLHVEPDGSVDHVAFRGEELLRGVRYIVRAAHSWETVVPEVQVRVEERAGRIRVTIHAMHQMPGATFTRESILEIGASGVRWRSTGAADAAFEANRNGYVVLHPLSVAGHPVTVTHPDGSSTAAVFPVEVSPHQPFRDVASFDYRTGSGLGVRLDFAGEVFETEDQRNWSDASYKTYSRPLALPYPYPTGAGESVEQSIALTVDARLQRTSSIPASASEPADTPRPPRPSLGVCLGPGDNPSRSADLARRIGLDHVRVDVVVSGGTERGVERFADLARTGVQVDLVVHVGGSPEVGLARLADAVRQSGGSLAALTIFDDGADATTERAWFAAHKALGHITAGVPVFAGSDDNFAELNRNRPDPAWAADGVSFALNPQLHDQREEAVLETIESLPAIVATASRLGAKVAIGALTLRPRRNIYLGKPIDRLGRDAGAIDPRQESKFAAEWLRGTLAALGAAGVARITAFDIQGPLGITDASGTLLPVGRVLSEFAGGTS